MTEIDFHEWEGQKYISREHRPEDRALQVDSWRGFFWGFTPGDRVVVTHSIVGLDNYYGHIQQCSWMSKGFNDDGDTGGVKVLLEGRVNEKASLEVVGKEYWFDPGDLKHVD